MSVVIGSAWKGIWRKFLWCQSHFRPEHIWAQAQRSAWQFAAC